MKKRNLSLWAVLFWLLVWQAGSMALHSDILLVSPLRVLQTLLALIQTTRFWSSLLGSMGRILGGFLLAAALGVCAALLLRLRRRGAASGKPMREKAVPLPVFLAGGGRMDRLRATRAVRELAQRLASMPEDSRALHPENILVRSGTLELKRAHGAGKRPGASVCAGYSAPECYNGSAGMAAAVYFLGAVLYALTEGRAPQDVIARAGGAELVFEEQTPLVPLLNRAMALNEAYRIAAPAQLAQELAQVEAQLAAAQPAQKADALTLTVVLLADERRVQVLPSLLRAGKKSLVAQAGQEREHAGHFPVLIRVLLHLGRRDLCAQRPDGLHDLQLRIGQSLVVSHSPTLLLFYKCKTPFIAHILQ